jgi:chemotaxis protein methyltransferase CheR
MDTLAPELFEQFARIAREQAGISLARGKEGLVSARIAKRLRALKLDSAGAYLAVLEKDPTGGEVAEFLNVISTNYTQFFREPDHFDALGDFVRSRVDAGQRTFRFWSAASATGEEPYTIAMTVLAALDGSSADVRVLATDISTRALEEAKAGRYVRKTIDAVPHQLREKYFRALAEKDRFGEKLYEVTPEVRSIVSYARLNLSRPPFPMKGPFDVIFCRNVMIYFSNEVRQALVQALEGLLESGGLLFTGHTESLAGMRFGMRTVVPSVYEKAGKA